ncbi:MAG: GatB/YqeY domain-containing protein [Patescibacteria group bacterium]|nr:GatB/YqeY domain-containing protein [Patescibacteria group bacterium]
MEQICYVLRVPCYVNIHQQIENDLKSALKSADKEKTGILRFLISAIKNHQIEKRAQGEKYLSDEDIILVVRRQAKQRKDSISEYEKGGRADLVQKEKKELEILGSYLPAQMNDDEIRKIVEAKMAKFGISDKTGFGKLMGAVMKELQGKADGSIVKKIIEEKLVS